MRKWTHGTVILDRRSNNHAMILYRDPVAQRGVYDARAMLDLTGFADHTGSFNVNIRMNDTVASDPCFAADIAMRGINEGYSCVQHQPADGTAAHQIFEFSQFGARVDARHFANIQMLSQADRLVLVSENCRNVGQIVFAL